MNMKETQQVMKSEEQFLSLYEYSGQGSRTSGLGKRVLEAAKERGIETRYKPLPEAMQTSEYKSVLIYPVSFLDEYFSSQTDLQSPIVRKSQLLDTESRINLLETRLKNLEAKFAEVIKKLEIPTKLEDDYDLPF